MKIMIMRIILKRIMIYATGDDILKEGLKQYRVETEENDENKNKKRMMKNRKQKIMMKAENNDNEDSVKEYNCKCNR